MLNTPTWQLTDLPGAHESSESILDDIFRRRILLLPYIFFRVKPKRMKDVRQFSESFVFDRTIT